jgi:hypothetical protein
VAVTAAAIGVSYFLSVQLNPGEAWYWFGVSVGVVCAVAAWVLPWRGFADDGVVKPDLAPSIAALAAASFGDGRLDLFAVVGGRLFSAPFVPGGTDLDWVDLELPARAWRVAATMTGRYRLECFAVDHDGRIRVKERNRGEWGGWAPLPFHGHVDAIAAVSMSPTHREVFVVTSEAELHHRWRHDRSLHRWDPWYRKDVDACKGVAAASSAGVIDCFVVTSDGSVLHQWWPVATDDHQWSGWEGWGRPPSGSVPLEISAYSSGARHEEVFVVGTEGDLHHQWQHGPGTPWAGWHGTPRPDLDGYVVAASYTSNQDNLHCFAGSTDGTLWGSSWTRGGNEWSPWRRLQEPAVNRRGIARAG